MVEVSGLLVSRRRFYSALGVLADQVVSRGEEHERTQFDARGNPWKKRTPTEWTAWNAGAGPGQLPLDAAALTWTHAHGPRGRLWSVESPAGDTWAYTWRADGQLAVLDPPVGPTRTYDYEVLGRLFEERVTGDDGAMQVTTYSYDGAQRTMNRHDVRGLGDDIMQTTHVDGRGRTLWARYGGGERPAGDIAGRGTLYSMDGAVRQVTEALLGGEPDRAYDYSYDPAGRLLSASEAGKRVDYSYLELGGGAVGVEVDPVVPGVDDDQFSRHFDLLGRLVQVDQAGAAIDLSWNPNGTLQSVSGWGLDEAWSYDHIDGNDLPIDLPHRPASISLTSADKSLTYAFAYRPGQPVNDIGDPWDREPWLAVTVTEDGISDTTKYWFDEQWRLERAEYPPLGGPDATRVEYTLRADGMRTAETRYTGPVGGPFAQSEHRDFDYTSLNHLRQIDRLNGDELTSVQVASDRWGRPSVYRVPDQADREMVWDAEGRMLSLTVVGSGETSRYAYNWRDQRIRRETPGESVESLWEGDGLLSEAVEVNGNTNVRTHLRGAGMVLAAGDVRLGHDWLGSPVMLGSAGGGFETRRYDAWGRIVAGDAPVSGGVQVGYTGHGHDPESGLTYAQARYYDPEVGLFLGPDPWDGVLGEPGTLSRFVYVGGSPLLNVDPDGRERRKSSLEELLSEAVDHDEQAVRNLSYDPAFGETRVDESCKTDFRLCHWSRIALELAPGNPYFSAAVAAGDYQEARWILHNLTHRTTPDPLPPPPGSNSCGTSGVDERGKQCAPFNPAAIQAQIRAEHLGYAEDLAAGFESAPGRGAKAVGEELVWWGAGGAAGRVMERPARWLADKAKPLLTKGWKYVGDRWTAWRRGGATRVGPSRSQVDDAAGGEFLDDRLRFHESKRLYQTPRFEEGPSPQLYGPYRRETGEEEIDIVLSTGELGGGPAQNFFASDFPAVKAFEGRLPDNRTGFEFFTISEPSERNPFMRWYRGASHSRAGELPDGREAVFIPVWVTKVVRGLKK